MSRFTIAWFLCLILIAGCRNNAPLPTKPVDLTPDADQFSLAKDNLEFALDLYQQIANQSNGNVMISPYSISSAIAMAYAGSRGETATQIAKVLRFRLEGERLHRAFSLSTQRMQVRAGENGGELDIANAVWGQQGIDCSPAYLELTKRWYGARLRDLDFKEPEIARGTINRWVAMQTREHIPALLGPNDLDAGTRLVITNAVYFQGMWKSPFPDGMTAEQSFRVSGDRSVPVPMMSQHKQERYGEQPGFKILRMRYSQPEFSMTILLPNSVDGLPALEKQLTIANLQSWLEDCHDRNVRISIPSFRSDHKYSLKSTLSAMRMRLPFDDDADFSGISSERFKIGEVIHKSAIQVDECGTKAVAATAVVVNQPVSQPAPPVIFRADHPFLYFISDESTGSILFMGRFIEPARAE